MEHIYFKQYHDPNDEPVAYGHIEVDIEQDLNIGRFGWLSKIFIYIFLIKFLSIFLQINGAK